MHEQSAAAGACGPRLQELLLGYLQAVEPLVWPGSDGLTLEDVVHC